MRDFRTNPTTTQRYVCVCLFFYRNWNYVQIVSANVDPENQNEKSPIRPQHGSSYYGSYGFEDDDKR